MSRTATVLSFGVLATFGSAAEAQRPTLNNRPGNIATLQNLRGLDWYTRGRALRIVSAGNGAGTVLGSRAIGGARSEVGLGFTPAREAFVVSATRPGAASETEVCTAETVSMNYLKQADFNLFKYSPASTIFPGGFIDARTLLQPSPAFYSAQGRAPLTVRLSISNPGAGAPDTAVVTDFGVNNIGQLHAQLRDRHFGARFPAQIIFRTDEVRSREELTAKLDVAHGVVVPLEEFGVPAEVSATVGGNASVTTSKTLKTYVMTLVQPMYSYGVTLVDKDRLFTTPGARAQHQNALMTSTVVFGRRVTMLIQSQEERTVVEGAVRQRLGLTPTGDASGIVQVGSRVEASVEQSFSNVVTTFRATFYGGNAQRANAVVSDPAAVVAYITDPSAASLTARTGEVPIEYRLEPVGSEATVGVRSTGTFGAESCVEPVYKLEVAYLGLKATKVVEAPLDDKEDIFGSIAVNRKTLKNIREQDRIELRANETSRDDQRVLISESITLGQLRGMRLTFDETLRDWELAIKPEYKPAQPIDLQVNLGDPSRIERALQAQRGRGPLPLFTREQELRLFENGDRQGSSISVLYQVFVTRL